MNVLFLVRLCLDFLAAGLLVTALAYYWLDNATHEVIGTGIFLLLIGHNIFNRRWWKSIAKGRREPRIIITKTMNISLLVTMLTLLGTSVIISQTVFSFLPISSTFTARQLHTLSAYWALTIVSVHLGWHWKMIMSVVAKRLGIENASESRVIVLRLAAAAISGLGACGVYQVDLASKLSMQMSLYQWDFANSTLEFFIYHLAIVGLGACLAHYASTAVKNLAARERKSVS